MVMVMGDNKVVAFELERYEKKTELGWFVTALFLIADMAGGGVVTMPVAMLQSGGIAGICIIIIICIAFAYTAYLLSENWLILCSRWSDYDSKHCRKPYPEMAYRAMGSGARTFCSCSLNVMLFGISVVYLLLSSHIINDFLSSLLDVNIGFCSMLLIVAIALWPITLLKSPQDFWWAIVVAMLTTLLSVLLILAGTAADYSSCSKFAERNEFKITSMVFSIGTFMFAFGGHAVFPTIQHDMKQPRKFTQSAAIAFCAIMLMYSSISVFGFITYGNSLDDSIINSIQTEWMQRAANLFIGIHCILTLTIVINPLNQEVEQFLRIPQDFGWQRVVVRTTVLLAVVFVAETVPRFGLVLNVMGGTATALTSVVMPSLFNLYLKASVLDRSSMKFRRPILLEVIRRTPYLRLSANLFVIALAIVGGMATTYAAVSEMSTTQFTVPCYLSSLNSYKQSSFEVVTRCCGASRNISRFGNAVCTI